jgi:methylated-DNA-[protein]-cysteine S-methyltransferase
MKFDASIVKTRFDNTLGPMTLAATDHGLAGVWFDDQRHRPDYAQWPEQPGHPVLREAVRQLRQYMAGERLDFDLPLDLHGGTPFQRSVWQALLQIPCGSTTSYGAIGQRLGKPKAVRAVGAAVGRNPVSIIVPCHRVMGSNGSLTGYAGGLHRKQALLKIETSPE